MGRLEGKTALITGAGTGVGRAALALFAAEGARVLGVGRTEATLAEATAAAGPNAAFMVGDLVSDGFADTAVAELVGRHGRLDIVVHAAGVGYSWAERSPGSMDAVDATSLAKWREVIGINLDAGFLVSRAAIAQMRKQGGGSIVHVSSISGSLGLPSAHAYTAAKAGLINLTRSLCVAYAKDGIRANCVAPGFIATPMVASVLSLFDDPALAEAITPMRRPGTPLEIAEACLFLASDAASYCNGSVLVADGGSSARQ
jgi:NAD(P)-dependent dehydrogenase (short-subunit alcohol dehydrogenase family)